MEALDIQHLSKSYGELTAVNDISFSVREGALFAFLGINGAGKSTTINMIAGILKKDAGKIFVAGHDLDADPFAIKRETGIVFQTSVLDKMLTVKQNLDIRTSFYSLPREARAKSVGEISELLELGPILSRPVGRLSGGQMRRVDIARAMVHRPRLLILDEPTTGLDPKTRLAVWSLIDRLRTETGMTVFLTTHYLEEAEKATDVVIMDKGNIIAHGTPNELKNSYADDNLIVYRPRGGAFESGLQARGTAFSYDDERGAYFIPIADMGMAKSLLKDFDGEISDAEIRKGTMDDVFLRVTGRDMKEEQG